MDVSTVCSALMVVFFTLQMTNTQAQSPCSSVKQGVSWVPDPADCKSFYICAFGMEIPLSCGEGTVWQPQKKVCCMKGSSIDTCTAKASPEPARGPAALPKTPKSCQPGMAGKLPHPKYCARYMDCASQGTVHGLRENQVRECPHPQLFNPKTGDCDHFDNVDCQDKVSPKDACDYERNKCQRSHCIPCFVRFASCTGFGDGKQVWKGRDNSPYYAECKNERVIKQGRCKNGELFSAEIKTCVDARSLIRS